MRFLLSSIVLGFLLVAVFSLGTPQAEAALGTACGSSSGKVTSVSAGNKTFTDTSKDWITDPAPVGDTWVGATVKITGGAGAGQSKPVTASTSNTITVAAAWSPVLDSTSTYTVSLTQTCADGGAAYSCKSTEEKGGRCAGPCGNDAVCVSDVGAKLGWGGAKCSSTVGGGQCMELPKSQLTTGPQSGSQLLATVDTLTNWVFAVFVVLAIIFVLLAAFQFVTAGGEATKVGEARQKLIWAVVGIVIALLAKGLVPVVRSITGG